MVPMRLGEKSKMLTSLQCLYNDALGFPHLVLFGAAPGRRPGANLRAVCCKNRLRVCKIEKSDFLKICQDKGFGELVLKI